MVAITSLSLIAVSCAPLLQATSAALGLPSPATYAYRFPPDFRVDQSWELSISGVGTWNIHLTQLYQSLYIAGIAINTQDGSDQRGASIFTHSDYFSLNLDNKKEQYSYVGC